MSCRNHYHNYGFILSFQQNDYIAATCRNLNCLPDAIGGVEDHLHLLIKLSKNIALSNLIEQLKKSSSKWIKKLLIRHQVNYDEQYIWN